MEYEEVLENARKRMSPVCRVCPVCDGLACGHLMPGPGSKPPGNGAYDNCMAWRRIRLNMDTITSGSEADTSLDWFGRTLSFPVFSGPVGSIRRQFHPEDDVSDYNEACLAAAEECNTMHAFGTGLEERVWHNAIESSLAHGNRGIPVFNPDSMERIHGWMDLYEGVEKPACAALVVDSAGLPHYRTMMGTGGPKSVEEIRALKEYFGRPMIVKGLMTVAGAGKALEAGADAIVVSNHGGRVLSDTPATAEVLPEIAEAVRGKMKILVDGGIRSGLDVFKALALGADACLICRPVLIASYGGGKEGVIAYYRKILAELEDTMILCGAHSLSEIRRDMVRVPKNVIWE